LNLQHSACRPLRHHGFVASRRSELSLPTLHPVDLYRLHQLPKRIRVDRPSPPLTLGLNLFPKIDLTVD